MKSLVKIVTFGALFAGWLAEQIGAPRTVATGGIVCLAAGTIFAKRLPSLRGEARQLIVAQGLAGGEPAAQMTGPGEQAPLETRSASA